MNEQHPAWLTRANVTGKIPDATKRGQKRGKRGKGKPDRKHTGSLKQRGLISPNAAAKHGI